MCYFYSCPCQALFPPIERHVNDLELSLDSLEMKKKRSEKRFQYCLVNYFEGNCITGQTNKPLRSTIKFLNMLRRSYQVIGYFSTHSQLNVIKSCSFSLWMIIPATSSNSSLNFNTGKPCAIFDLTNRCLKARRYNEPLPHIPEQTRVLAVQGLYIYIYIYKKLSNT